MTNYRVINMVHHSLEDNEPHLRVPRSTSELVWKGDHTPSHEDLIAPVEELVNTYLGTPNYGEMIYEPTLQIQRQRISKLLGWKTLKAVGIVEFFPKDTMEY